LEEAVEALRNSDNFLSITRKNDLFQSKELSLRISVDSRKCSKDSLFIAIPGNHTDGHRFLQDVCEKGSKFFIVEKIPINFSLTEDITVIVVKSARLAWSSLCALAFGYPQKQLSIVGVTGTNGKTSIVWMIHQLFNGHKLSNVAIGTLGIMFPGEFYDNSHTTPDPDLLFQVFRLAVDRGIKYVIMEVSSHSLVQSKLNDVKFSVAIFSSFSRDHLDFHKDLDDYFSAKLKLFTEYVRPNSALLLSMSLKDRLKKIPFSDHKILYGFETPCNLAPENKYCSLKLESMDLAKSEMTLNFYGCKEELLSNTFKTTFFSYHALENLSAAILTFYNIIMKMPDHDKVLNIKPVPGRLELITPKEKKEDFPICIVDYAHTPDALEKTLLLLRALTKQHISVVFGCGGNRDKGKRPLMGKIAAENSDSVIVTSDNPRNEDPLSIAREIEEGVPPNLLFKVELELDREKAIGLAIKKCSELNPKGVVLIAGKGHESYQIIGNQRLEFSDQACIRKFFLSEH
jgi:UDP-N-acetylmuramoyl-L-alanyl-D-glutamate--2,6-diaminopimelate ligase